MAVEVETKASIPTIVRIDIEDVDSGGEIGYLLPLGTVRFSMQSETSDDVNFALKSGDLTLLVYGTMKGGAPYTETELNPAGIYIIYFTPTVAGTPFYVQVTSWR
jgi:hypothetical protein